jgi:hypothetical protein
MFRLDRNNGRKAGGVSLFTSLSILANRRLELDQNGLELFWVEMQINRLFFVCCVCYQPPNSNQASNVAFLDYLQSFLDQIYLYQIINQATRVTAFCAILLDLIIANSPGFFFIVALPALLVTMITLSYLLRFGNCKKYPISDREQKKKFLQIYQYHFSFLHRDLWGENRD